MGELTGKPLGIEVAKRVMGWTEWQHFSSEYPLYKIGWGDYIEVKHSSEGVWVEWAPWRDWNDMKEVMDVFWGGWNGHAAAFVRISALDDVLRPNAIISASDIGEVSGWGDTIPVAFLRAALAVAEQAAGEEASNE